MKQIQTTAGLFIWTCILALACTVLVILFAGMYASAYAQAIESIEQSESYLAQIPSR